MLESREAYAYGFLERCAASGIGPEAALGLARAAALEKRGYGVWEAMRDVAGPPLVAGALVGVPLGAMAAHLRERPADPEAIRKRELIDAYDAHARLAEARRKALRPPAPPRRGGLPA